MIMFGPRFHRLLVAMALLVACGKEPATQPAPAADLIPTPNQLFAAGSPTFVLGTLGDDDRDRRIATQVGLLRGLALPDSRVVTDAAVDRSAWPKRAVLYGGPAENALFAEVAGDLGIEVNDAALVLGGERFEGEGVRLVAAVPADPPRHPSFVVFCGTGSGGIGEINANLPTNVPILVADGFGPLAQGTWERDAASGRWRPKLDDARGTRIEYRTESRRLAGATMRFHFPAMVAPRPGDAAAIEASMRGLKLAVRKLAIEAPVPLEVFVYPDRRSKVSLTRSSADGHAVPSSRGLHLLPFDTSPGGGHELLVAHEATHVLGYYAWGPAGTALLGEGLAGWVAGAYAGKTLDQWGNELPRDAKVAPLLGPGWAKLSEAAKYPLAGLFVEVALAEVGPEAVRDHLLGATPETWARACRAAGSTPERLQAALTRRLMRAKR